MMSRGLCSAATASTRTPTNLSSRSTTPPSARAWLATIASRITTAERAMARGDECYLNLAFTRTGLAKLGMSEAVSATFPTAFFEGMASENRSRILGDSDDNAPENWNWGGPERRSTRSS